MERVAGIEPAPSAWKAEVLPLNYTRIRHRHPNVTRERRSPVGLCGGGGWIRTSEAFASDLQSDPFGRSGTPPKEPAIVWAEVKPVNVSNACWQYVARAPRRDTCEGNGAGEGN